MSKDFTRYDICRIAGGGFGIFPKEKGKYYKADDVDEYIKSIKEGVITIKEEKEQSPVGWYLFKWKSTQDLVFEKDSDFRCYYFDGENWYSNNNCHEDARASKEIIESCFKLITKIGIE